MPNTAQRKHKRPALTSAGITLQTARFQYYLQQNPGLENIVCDVPLCPQHCMRGTSQSDESLISGIITFGWRMDEHNFITCQEHSK